MCTQNAIRYNGTIVYKSMLTAAQNCYERLNDRANRTLRYIEGHSAGNKSYVTSSSNTLNRVLQACATEVQKSNGVMWGCLTVPEITIHVFLSTSPGRSTIRR